MLHRDIVNQLHNDNGLSDAGSAEEANLAALQIGLDEVHHLNSGLEHIQRGGLILEGRRRAMNLVVRIGRDGAQLIHGLAKDVHDAAKRGPAHRDGNSHAQVIRFHAANHSFDGLHGHRADASFAEVLLHLRCHVERFW